MPHRAFGFALAAAGLVVVLALVVAKRDVYATTIRGPRWRRRLLAAGIALLSVVGLPSLHRRAQALPGPSGGKDEAGAREWNRIIETFTEADAVASGKRGLFPFDEKGKKRLLEQLAAASKDADVVGLAWKLSPAEVGLLKKGLARLVEGVQEKRPKEMERATCYEPMPASWAQQQSVRRLADRLPLLEKAAAAGRLRAEVIRRAIAHVQQDLALLDAPGSLSNMSPKERKEAEKLRKAVRDKLAAIEAKFKK